MKASLHLKLRVVIGMVGLVVISAVAAGMPESPRLWVICGLVALVLVGLVGTSLQQLEARAPCHLPDLPFGVPQEAQVLSASLRRMELHLEHAPLALFQIVQLPGNESQVTALNANARRLVAPGRASAPLDLYKLLDAQPVDRRSVIGFDSERGLERAVVSVSALVVDGQSIRLAALMPVESELEAEALSAWRQLVHVLTHEIMNSLTPVASLSHTACELVAELRPGLRPDLPDSAQDTVADLQTALDTIARRADSLIHFVTRYRSLSTVPQAQPQRVRLSELFARVSLLVNPGWRARDGLAEFSVNPDTLELLIDAGQFEQALLNLLQNAAEATANCAKPHAQVSARLARGGRLRIEVGDNGPGVPGDLVPHIFTPFFSTKKQGGGIGLAMVRHLIHANGGTVRYAKSVGAGARFVITF
jgi:signal transduction histidine kinase